MLPCSVSFENTAFENYFVDALDEDEAQIDDDRPPFVVVVALLDDRPPFVVVVDSSTFERGFRMARILRGVEGMWVDVLDTYLD